MKVLITNPWKEDPKRYHPDFYEMITRKSVSKTAVKNKTPDELLDLLKSFFDEEVDESTGYKYDIEIVNNHIFLNTYKLKDPEEVKSVNESEINELNKRIRKLEIVNENLDSVGD